ncbi:MAG: lipopolysaccharide transport periplasmic protein LptA [Burkholderiales bacterium]|nr:lipopolysaccharide transport periplasmic protein LptA [Burkholderiales bacterium]
MTPALDIHHLGARPARRRAWALALLGAFFLPPAQAEKADRFKPLNVEADQPGKIDLQNQFVVFNGNVVVSKGTMLIRAARIEVRETPGGYHTAVATGAPGKPATFRQKRDGVDEYIAGEAEKLEYDGKTDTIRFVTNASVRRLRGATVADEIAGNLVTYDSTTEVFSVSGGAAPTPTNPGGRVRAVLTPREGSEAAAEAASAASAPTPTLRLSPALGEKR